MKSYTTFRLGGLTVLFALLVAACSPAAEQPHPMQPRRVLPLQEPWLMRFFEKPTGLTPEEDNMISNGGGDVTVEVKHTTQGFWLSMRRPELTCVRDQILIQLQPATVKPGLVGTYVIPLLNGQPDSTTSSPLHVYHKFTDDRALPNRQDFIFRTTADRFLPGSHLIINRYDSRKKLISGRFEFRYPIRNPTVAAVNQVNGPNDWEIKIIGRFTDTVYKDLLTVGDQ